MEKHLVEGRNYGIQICSSRITQISKHDTVTTCFPGHYITSVIEKQDRNPIELAVSPRGTDAVLLDGQVYHTSTETKFNTYAQCRHANLCEPSQILLHWNVVGIFLSV